MGAPIRRKPGPRDEGRFRTPTWLCTLAKPPCTIHRNHRIVASQNSPHLPRPCAVSHAFRPMSRPAPEVLRQVTGHVRRRRRRRVLRGSSRAATVLPARSTFPSLPHSYSSLCLCLALHYV
jgi:hypothetical protein